MARYRLWAMTAACAVVAIALALLAIGCESSSSGGGQANTKPAASFTASPATGTTETVFSFNASGSTDKEDPTSALQVRWDWEDDGTYDTGFSTTKAATHQFGTVGQHTVRVQVRDTGGLTCTVTRSITITGGEENQPPTAAFDVTPATGPTATVFSFDGSGSSDPEDSSGELQVRWDWTDDGTYDTGLSTGKTATHQYAAAGTYTIRMEVQDTGGLTDTATHTVTVTGGEPTGVGVLFIHHSVGDDLVTRGNVRDHVATYNAEHGTAIDFWDHGYNSPGLRNPAGEFTGSYEIPGDNTDVEGYYNLWTSSEAEYVTCRNQILGAHQVIAFKSCFPNSQIESAAQLAQYKTWYLAIRDFFDTRTDIDFVVMSPPPLHRLSNDPAWATRARNFANWLGSSAYLSGHPNVHYFDLFNLLANPDNGSATANMLRAAYEGSPDDGDSHPNEAADIAIGPTFANALCDIAAAR